MDLVIKEAKKCKKIKELLYKLKKEPEAPNKSVIQEGIMQVEVTLKEFYKFEDNIKNNDGDDASSEEELLPWLKGSLEIIQGRNTEAKSRLDNVKKRKKGGKIDKILKSHEQ